MGEDFGPMNVLLQRVLAGEGHRVTTAATGLAAREACATTPFDVFELVERVGRMLGDGQG